MKTYLLLVLLSSGLFLNACSKQQPSSWVATQVPTPAPELAKGNQPSGVQAAGRIVPAKYTEMGFLEAAPVKEILVKENDQVTTGQNLVRLDVPVLEYAVVSAEAAVESAESFARLQRFRRTILNQKGKTLYLTGPHEVLEVADAKVIQAQAALEKARAELALSTLTAPYPGTVVEVNAAEGAYIPSGQPAVILADLSQFQIETTDLNERDVSRLHAGQRAEIQIPALDQSFYGSISQISPKADFVDGDVVYKIVLAMDLHPAGLLWGMSADVFFMDE